MSLIHEALEKLEGEKKSPWKKPSPPLSQPEILEKEQVRTANTTVIYAIAGALIFFFLVGLVYFFTVPKETPNASQPRLQAKELAKRPSSLLQNLSAQRFKLSGITRVGTDWTAIVNNRLVRMGESINGANVLTIREDEVVLDLNGETIHLTLYGDSSTHFTRLEAAR